MTPGPQQHRAQARVLVVSDVFLYRQGLTEILTRAGVPVVSGVGGTEAEAKAAAEAVDIVVLDAAVDGALRLARSLRANGRRKVIGFGIGDADEEVLACAEAGLAGFVPRSAGGDGLKSAIERAMRNEVHCSPRATALVFAQLAALSRPVMSDGAMLTPREREVARLIADGFSNKEIAAKLRLSLATVKNYTHSVLEKFGVRRRSGVARHVLGAEGSNRF